MRCLLLRLGDEFMYMEFMLGLRILLFSEKVDALSRRRALGDDSVKIKRRVANYENNFFKLYVVCNMKSTNYFLSFLTKTQILAPFPSGFPVSSGG